MPPSTSQDVTMRPSMKKATEGTKIGTAVGYTPKMVAFERKDVRAQTANELATY